MSRVKYFFIIFSLMSLVQVTFQASASEVSKNLESINLDGSARIRFELKDNLSDSNKDADDKADFIGSRIRLGLMLNVNPKAKIYIQSQITKTFGNPELATAGRSSGALQDSRFDVHQAYLNYSFKKDWSFWAGRQELAYGNHLVIGNVGWSNVGRAFDALRARKTLEEGFVDIFWTQIEEGDTNATFNADHEFSGLYFHKKELWSLDELEAYFLSSNDNGNVSPSPKAFITYGARLKKTFNKIDLGLESTQQTDFDSNQMDVELGYKFGKARAFVGYAIAHKDYQQLYPTGHKFFGSADLLGRRNLKALRLGVASKIFKDKMNLKLSYHSFSRNDELSPIYALSGSVLTGSTGAEAGLKIADELDVSLNWSFAERSHLLIGGAYVKPGEYLKNVRGKNDNGFFTYVQTGTSF